MMGQTTLDRWDPSVQGCPYRAISTHNGYAYCYEPTHMSKWGYACYCPPIGCGDPPHCPESIGRGEKL